LNRLAGARGLFPKTGVFGTDTKAAYTWNNIVLG
jgi:hypothetical protein